jgi:hypothetical protein
MTPEDTPEIKKKQLNLIRYGIFQITEVLPFVVFSGNQKRPKNSQGKLDLEARANYAGYQVWMTSLRLQLFAKKGLSCVKCGIIGCYFALENFPKNSHNPHFNLYGQDASGDEVLITKDHIHPKSLGGSDALDNLQTMCYPCNHAKSNKI